jgi:hypothetical protein
VLRRAFAVLALPGCALAFAPDSTAADILLVSGTDPLSGGESIVARPPGGFEGGAYSSGALEGVALPLHPDWEVILAGGRDDHEAESTLSHRVTSRYRLNESLTLRASWQGDLLASGRTAPHAAGAIGDVRPCDSRPHVGGPKRCNGFRAEHAGAAASTLRPRDAGTFRVGAATRAGPLFVSLDWFRVGPSESPASPAGPSTLDVAAWGTPPSGPAVRRGRDIVTRMASHAAASGESELAGIDVHARTGWRSYGADFALDTRWLHLTGREDRMAGESQRGDFPRNHVQASLRAGRSGFSARWKVRTVSGFWNNLRNTRYAAWIRHDITFRKRDAFGLRGVDLVGGVLNLRNHGSSTDPGATSAAGATDKLNPAAGRTLFLSAKLSLDS